MRYIPTLDGWRAVAILLVIIGHAIASLGLGTHRISALLHVPEWYIGAQMNFLGERGVQLFFGISGLLITSKLIEERERTGSISLSSFYLRRATRILPASSIYLIVLCLLSLAGVIAIAPREIAASFLFFRNYLNDVHWFTGHFWSLSVEEHFYLLWPLLLVVLNDKAKWFAVVGTVAVVALRYFNQPAMDTSLVRFHTEMTADALMLGSLSAIAFQPMSKFLRGRWLLWAGCAVTFALILPTNTWCRLLQAVLAPILLVGTITNGSRLLESSLFKWIGRVSYSLYLWQQLFLPRSTFAEVPIRIVAIFACAYLSYRFIETPMISLGHRMTESPSKHLAAAAS